MKEKINDYVADSEITLLSFNDKDFKNISWIDGTELIINGILYDLVSIEKKESGLYIVKVISDKKEKQVLDIMLNNTDQNSTAKKCFHVLVQLFSQFSESCNGFSISDNSPLSKNDFVYLDNYSFSILRKFSPPPKISLF